MSQPYQNPPASGYGSAYGSTYYSPQSPYGARPQFSPTPYPQHGGQPPASFQPTPTDGYNVARFDANNQAHPPAQPFPFAPSSFPPEMLKQFANSSIPPPPPPGFPPLSFPNLNFPLFPPVPVAPNQTYSPPQEVESDEGSDAYDPRFPQNLPQTSRQTMGASLKKPSQISDTATDTQQILTQASAHTAFASRQNGSDLPSNIDAATLSVQSHPQSQPASSALYTEAKTPNSPHVQKASAQLPSPASHEIDPPSESHDILPANSTAVNILRPQENYDQMDTFELRALAKDALSSLATHNIIFDDLIKEGINPIVLNGLYNELGISTRAASLSSQAAEALTSTAQPVLNDPAKNTVSQTASTASPSLERKDRIAQLLAAKAARPSPVRTTSESATSAGLQQIAGAAPAVLHASQTVTPVVEDASAALKSAGAARAEIVRQRMEQLRKDTVESTAQSPRTPLAKPTPSVPFQSTLPGLGMMAADLDLAPPAPPTKRPFEDDTSSADIATKRQNTGQSSRGDDVEMEIDQPTSAEASEGEVVESPQPVTHHLGGKSQDAQSAPQVETPNPTVPPAKPIAPTTGAKLTPAQLAEKAKELKARFLQQRARKQALQEGIPSIAAEVAKTEDLLTSQRTQLEDTRRRIKALELELDNARQQEQAQLAQIQSSEEQVQQAVTGQKKFTEELQTLNNEQKVAGRSMDDAQQLASSPAVPTDQQVDGVSSMTHDVLLLQRNNDKSEEPTKDAASNVTPSEKVQEDEGEATPHDHDDKQHEENSYKDASSDLYSASMGESSDPDSPNDQVNSAEDQSTVRDHIIAGIDGAATDHPAENPDMDDNASEGSVSMIDSASDASLDEGEYSPVEDDLTQPMEIDGGSSEDYDPTDAPVEFITKIDEEEQVDKMSDPPSQEDGEVQLTIDNGEAEKDAAPTAVEEGLTLIEQQELTTEVGAPRINGSDSDYQLSRNSAPATPNGRWNYGRQRPTVKPLANNGVNRSTSFSAYESPLTSFPSYRYNEHFNEAAKDGFRSLTYSNSIDPRTPLCPTELSGEVCQDSTCEEQHFRHLGLSDDKILVQMSSAHEFTDKDTRDSYLLGLKAIIADLRSRNVRDFEDVAKALSEYRRTFVAAL